LACQKEVGVGPQGCELTKGADIVTVWDAMTAKLKPILTREIEVYAENCLMTVFSVSDKPTTRPSEPGLVNVTAFIASNRLRYVRAFNLGPEKLLWAGRTTSKWRGAPAQLAQMPYQVRAVPERNFEYYRDPPGPPHGGTSESGTGRSSGERSAHTPPAQRLVRPPFAELRPWAARTRVRSLCVSNRDS